MADELATVTELQLRLDWTLDTGEQSMAETALADLSDDARFYGSQRWDSDAAPRQAKSLVLRAAARFMRNPDGYTQSRAGDETLQWNDAAGEDAGTPFFTEREQKILGELAGRGTGLISAPIVAHGPVRASRSPRYVNPYQQGTDSTTGYVPTEGAPHPWYAGEQGTF